MNWLMSYGAKLFAVLTMLSAGWQVTAKPTTMQVITLVLAVLTVLVLWLPQPKTPPPKT